MVADNPNLQTPKRPGAKAEDEQAQLSAQVERLTEHVLKAQQHALEMGSRALELAAQEVRLQRKVEFLESIAAARCIRTVITKRRSIGPTQLCVAPKKSKVKLAHSLFCLPALPLHAEREYPMVVGQVALVHYEEALSGEVYEPHYVNVIHQRATDVIDLSAAIFTARVGKKEDRIAGELARSDVDQATLVVLPDGVEFRFDHDTWDLPDCPAYQLFSALSDNMLWNDCEAFERWFSGQGFTWDKDGFLVRANVGAKFGDVS